MSDNKKYYYLKLKDNFFDSDEMIILESQQDGYLYSNILLKLYLRSLKIEGRLAFSDLIPYDSQMLAALTRHQVGTVEKALKMFEALGLVEILDNGAIYMTNIQNFIGQSSNESDRKRIYRERILTEKTQINDNSEICGDKFCDLKEKTDICPDKCPQNVRTNVHQRLEIRDKRIENRDNIYILSTDVDGREALDYQEVVDLFNRICVSLPKVKTITDIRKQKIRTANKQLKGDFKSFFKKIEDSDFLSGRNGAWTACGFDWALKPTNTTKILEGNYDNKEAKKDESYQKNNRFDGFDFGDEY